MHDRRRTSSQRAFRLPLRGLLLAAVCLAACETSVVSLVEVSQVEVYPPRLTLVEGSRETVSAILRESGGVELSGRTVTWTVEDSDVATVTSEGVVEGRAPGNTLIHASSGGVSGAAEVTVLPGPDHACDIRNHTFVDDFEIPRNTRCVFTNVHVRGDLDLREGARLIAADLRVDGALEANSADELILTEGRIHGHVKFEKGGSVTISDSYIDGKLELKSNRGSLDVRDNTIEDEVKLEKNSGGPFTLFRNTIDGKLECKDNEPLPTGGGNVVDDEKVGQCRDL